MEKFATVELVDVFSGIGDVNFFAMSDGDVFQLWSFTWIMDRDSEKKDSQEIIDIFF